MVIEEKCKIVVKGTTWRVNECTNPKGEGTCYRVMRNRNIAQGGSFFRNESEALRFMLRECFMEISTMSVDFEV